MDNPNDPFLVHLGKFNNHRKVFVEPIPGLFQKLKNNLASMPNTTFINAAVNSAAEGTLTAGARKSKQEVEELKRLMCNASLVWHVSISAPFASSAQPCASPNR